MVKTLSGHGYRWSSWLWLPSPSSASTACTGSSARASHPSGQRPGQRHQTVQPQRGHLRDLRADGRGSDVNYLDLGAQPQIVRDIALPWSITLSTTAPAASANIVAQGDTDTVGCRIVVDGVLKDEKTSTGVNAQTFRLVKSA